MLPGFCLFVLFGVVMIHYIRTSAVVKDSGDRFRDTLVLTIRGDGVDIPAFFIKGEYGNASYKSGRRPSPDHKPVKGMTIPLMKDYIDHLDSYVTEQSILLMDRLSSHTSPEVLNYLKRKRTAAGIQKFIPILLKPKTSFLISPLDHSAIAQFKKNFYRYDRSTIELKEAAAYRAWREVSNENLLGYLNDCGIVGSESTDSLYIRFMKEVRGGIPEKNLDDWTFYEMWMYGAVSVAGVPAPRGTPLEVPEQLSNTELDGRYWHSYGRNIRS
jgi:hypothetical protein